MLLFILEEVIHIGKINGFQVFAYNPKAEDTIREILDPKRGKIKVKHSLMKQENVKEANFRNNLPCILNAIVRV